MKQIIAAVALSTLASVASAEPMDMVGSADAGGMVTCYSQEAAIEKQQKGLTRQLITNGDCFVFKNNVVARVDQPDQEISQAIFPREDNAQPVYVFPADMIPASHAPTSVMGRAPAAICHTVDDAVTAHQATNQGNQMLVETMFRSGRCALVKPNYIASIDNPGRYSHVYEVVVSDRGYTVAGYIAKPFLH